jgi:DNA polymerase
MTTIHCDFETRATVELKHCGVHVYASHPDTAPWCMAYAIGEGPVELWRLGEPFPDDLFELSMNDDTLWMAHNAAFELAIWNRLCVPRFGWPVLPLERTRCTMAMAYALALPGSLEAAAGSVGLDIGKDMTGRTLMMKMAKPRKVDPLTWWDSAENLERLYAYCRTDVEVERALEKRLQPLSEAEQRLWEFDQTVNDRGIHVDIRAVDAAMAVADAAKARLDTRMALLTKGNVATCSKMQDLKDWIASKGIDVDGLAKADITDLLETELPDDVRKALELRREAGKSSVAKLKAMKRAANDDGRARGLNQFHGAATGRWAGRRIQTQNFPRSTMAQADIDEVLEILSS